MNSRKKLSRQPVTSVLIKPAGPDCNMACTYCFYLEKAHLFSSSQRHRMTIDLLETTVKQVLTQGKQEVTFGWQGGEPTLMGLDFFRRAVEFQQQYGQRQIVGNGLQTNGLLLNQQWAKFLREYNFLVGLSLDGPEHIHNRYRRLRGGQGSWEIVVDRAQLLLEAGVATNALVVVNDYSVKFPDEIYDFLKSLGLTYMQFIPCLERDPKNPQLPTSFSVPASAYGRFLIRLFERWLADFHHGQPTTYIRYFESLFYTYVGQTPPECTLLKKCGVYVVIEHNGDVFSCDFFVEPAWKLGNIKEQKIIDMLNSARQRKFGQRKADLPLECRRCRWLIHCRGGCPKERGFLPHPERSYFCPAYQQFLEYAHPSFCKLAKEWQERHHSSPHNSS